MKLVTKDLLIITEMSSMNKLPKAAAEKCGAISRLRLFESLRCRKWRNKIYCGVLLAPKTDYGFSQLINNKYCCSATIITSCTWGFIMLISSALWELLPRGENFIRPTSIILLLCI